MMTQRPVPARSPIASPRPSVSRARSHGMMADMFLGEDLLQWLLLALGGALLLVVTGALSLEDARNAIDIEVLVVIVLAGGRVSFKGTASGVEGNIEGKE